MNKLSKGIEKAIAIVAALNATANQKFSDASLRFVRDIMIPCWNESGDGNAGENTFRLQIADAFTRAGFDVSGDTLKVRISEFCKVLRKYDSAAILKKVNAITANRTKGQGLKSALTAMREIASAMPKQEKTAKQGAAKVKGAKKEKTVKSKAISKSATAKAKEKKASAADVNGKHKSDETQHPVMRALHALYDNCVGLGKSREADAILTDARTKLKAIHDVASEQRGKPLEPGETRVVSGKARAQAPAKQVANA